MFEQNSDVDKTAAVGSSAEITLVVALLRKHHTTNSEKIHAEISEKFFQAKKYKTAAGQTGGGNPSCETCQLAGGASLSPTLTLPPGELSAEWPAEGAVSPLGEDSLRRREMSAKPTEGEKNV